MNDEYFADDGEGMRCAFAGRVFVSFIYAKPTLDRMNFLWENESRWVANVDKFSAISIIDPRVGKEMPPDARQKAREISDAMRGKRLVSCIIVEGTGFFAALVRSVVAGLQIASSRRDIAYVVANVDEAIERVSAEHDKLGVPFDKDAVRVALGKVSGKPATRSA